MSTNPGLPARDDAALSLRGRWLAASVFWLFIALLSGIQIWLLSQQPGETIAVRRALIWQTTYYLAWIPFTVPIWQLVARLHTGGARWPGLALGHLLGSLAVGALQSLVVVSIASTLDRTLSQAFGQMVRGQFQDRIYLQIVIYAGIVAAGMAFVWHGRWRDRAEAASRLEAQLAEAQVAALRAQLNPHFLFNSLHAVSSLVREARNPEAVRLIADMSSLLRRVLDTGRVWHPLAEELALVRTYFDVQQVRFEDRLTATITMAPECADIPVPVLLLQPLVENALRHGLAGKPGPGRVTVTTNVDGATLAVEVADDGAGAAPGTWKNGTGLANLRARLATLYGGKATMDVETAAGRGFTIRIRLPVEAP